MGFSSTLATVSIARCSAEIMWATVVPKFTPLATILCISQRATTRTQALSDPVITSKGSTVQLLYSHEFLSLVLNVVNKRRIKNNCNCVPPWQIRLRIENTPVPFVSKLRLSFSFLFSGAWLVPTYPRSPSLSSSFSCVVELKAKRLN